MIKTKQLHHQEEVYEEHRDDLFFALFWEMGLGKTKEMIDVASYLHEAGRIDAMLICAPNAVYRNWITQEIPQHMGAKRIAMAFPKTDKDRDEIKRLLFLDPGLEPGKLRVVAIGYDAVRTERGWDFLTKYTTIYRTMIIADESTAIGAHNAQITKRMKKLRKNCFYAWIATGTPASDGPFKIHSQIEFLDPEFWKRRGLRTFGAFKNYFGVFAQKRYGRQVFQQVVGYQRIDELRDMIAVCSSRLLKEDSTVELPPKTYTLRTFEMSDRQQMVYNDLKTQLYADIEAGVVLEAALAVTRLMRLQQITSGFVTVEKLGPMGEPTGEYRINDLVDPSENPRLQLLLALLEEAHHKVIVWARFRREIDHICTALGDRAVRYDGSVNDQHRTINLDRFRDARDPARVLVANVAAISQGVTLTIAKTMVYYSNTFSLEKRLQSEDRFHRIGQTSPVQIIDLAAERTVDLKIIERLRNKYDVAALVTGDQLREWIK